MEGATVIINTFLTGLACFLSFLAYKLSTRKQREKEAIFQEEKRKKEAEEQTAKIKDIVVSSNRELEQQIKLDIATGIQRDLAEVITSQAIMKKHQDQLDDRICKQEKNMQTAITDIALLKEKVK